MSARKTVILIVDDDVDLREVIAEQLDQTDEYSVLHAGTAGEGLAKADQAGLILLDVNLPDIDGREACRRLRDRGLSTPVILLTALDEEGATVEGLESGANDYVTKPFKFSVLLARIRAHLRVHENTEDAVFRIGPYEFRPGLKQMMDGGAVRIRLTDKETSILKYLYRAGAKAVGREELLREVWGYNSNVTTHTLETHIYRLRQKIEPDPDTPKLLITESGGYRLQS